MNDYFPKLMSKNNLHNKLIFLAWAFPKRNVKTKPGSRYLIVLLRPDNLSEKPEIIMDILLSYSKNNNGFIIILDDKISSL